MFWHRFFGKGRDEDDEDPDEDDYAAPLLELKSMRMSYHKSISDLTQILLEEMIRTLMLELRSVKRANILPSLKGRGETVSTVNLDSTEAWGEPDSLGDDMSPVSREAS